MDNEISVTKFLHGENSQDYYGHDSHGYGHDYDHGFDHTAGHWDDHHDYHSYDHHAAPAHDYSHYGHPLYYGHEQEQHHALDHKYDTTPFLPTGLYEHSHGLNGYTIVHFDFLNTSTFPYGVSGV